MQPTEDDDDAGNDLCFAPPLGIKSEHKTIANHNRMTCSLNGFAVP